MFMVCYTDIDECIPGGGNVCPPQESVCIDTSPGYSCQCKTGFTGNGTVCQGKERFVSLRKVQVQES